ncbi:MarR family winged helix-turn-helix transcriptional regulator [Cellulomonas sp. S1-8]|uniref:MarR family winged helix-turn-helix transcriptional regulator n=1 Tax=Cellulomonas sp. S1-8 TaxID=2904790 RepID=UPI0022440D62|nr:MarR family winged helix-turn-helix transcriptional regulator [Cellulomonas sp. S1-8]UZN04515.1 MarR family winged helix-turn-helix transcriptional regulator [Cellulomonas sp. S1-8]
MSRPADHPLGNRVTVTLHHLVDVLDEYADHLLRAGHGVTLSQYLFLAVLSDLDHPDVTTLARCLRVTKAAVSKRVGSFVDAGWIRTVSDPANARRVVLELTPAGATLVDVAGRQLEDEFTAAFAHVEQVDLGALHVDLTTVLSTMRGALAERVPGSPLV